MKFSHRVVLMSATLGLALAVFAGTEQASAALRCSRYVSPVCGLRADGLRATYTNACYARRGGAMVLHGGACQGPDLHLGLAAGVCPECVRGRP